MCKVFLVGPKFLKAVNCKIQVAVIHRNAWMLEKLIQAY